MFAAAGGWRGALPDRIVEPQFHNPFPQIYRVAVLPFFNQSAEPTVDGDAVAMAYYNELQTIPGFEVMPVGVAKQMLAASIAATGTEPRGGAEFQRLARQMGVDAVLVGSITEYSPYYPPRIGLAVDWYAANPSFHPIPPGYGLPWGRAEEEFIPSTLVQEAEFALAREQLKTQTPDVPPQPQAVIDGKVAPVSHIRQPRHAWQTCHACQTHALKCAREPTGNSRHAQRWTAADAAGKAGEALLAAAPAAASPIGPIHGASSPRRPAASTRAASAARSAHDAHADLSRPGRKVYRAIGDVLLPPRRRPLRRLARLSGAAERLHPVLLLSACD